MQRAHPQGPSPRVPPVDEHYGGTTNEQIYSQWGISQPPSEPPQVQALQDGGNAGGRPRSQSYGAPEQNRGRQAAAPGQVGGGRMPKFIQELEKHRKGINHDDPKDEQTFWNAGHAKDGDQFTQLYVDTLARFDGDKVATMQHIEALRRQGKLQ